MKSTILTSAFDPELLQYLESWFGLQRVSVTSSAHEFAMLAKSGEFAACVVPFFWPGTTGVGLVRKLKEEGVKVDKFMLILPRSMEYADGWTSFQSVRPLSCRAKQICFIKN